MIPGDGDVVEGIASVDESAITGESAPVIREAGGDRSAVTGGTRVLSDRIVVRITAKPGETFLDRMIALVEGAARQKTPNEIALNILLASLTIIFMLAVVTLQPLAIFIAAPAVRDRAGLAAGLPDPDHDRRAAVARSASPAWTGSSSATCWRCPGARSRRPATSTPCCSTRPARSPSATARRSSSSRWTASTRAELADAAQLSSLADETPEGRSIVVLAKREYGLRDRTPGELTHATFVPFSAQTRMSGCDLAENGRSRSVRKGATSAVASGSATNGGTPPADLGPDGRRDRRRRRHAAGRRRDRRRRRRGCWASIHLKDIVKNGMRERFDELRRMGIRTVMITGDNPLTAKAIADEAGVDDFLAEATPEDKLALIRQEQEGGRLVAMTGDGTNDAPALAQADVGVAMNTGTSAAKEAGNMVDLDSNPTKLIEIVEIGKQLLITRGVADDVLHRQRRREVLRDPPGDVRRRSTRAWTG